jgi:hypothetical protein
MKPIFIYLIVICLLLPGTGCDKKDDNTNNNNNTGVTGEIDGPPEEDYDFYVAFSYSGTQPVNNDYKHYYILITCTDSLQSIESIDLYIQDEKINLEYANYGGDDFYIAYFNLKYADTYTYELTINDETTQISLRTIKELFIDLPETLVEDEDLVMLWETDIDPMNTYIEGFQWSANNEIIKKHVENFSPETRNFTMPASWLWSEGDVASRSVQIGIKNYVVKNRICVTMNADSYKGYE